MVVGVIGAVVGGDRFGNLIPAMGAPDLKEIVGAVLAALTVLFVPRLIKRV